MRSGKTPWVPYALLVSATFVLGWSPLAALVDIPVRNWQVPLPKGGSPSPQADIGGALPFVPVTPCRVVDTRNADGPYGGPKLGANGSRNFNILAGGCTGIPSSASAFSLNFTVTQTDGDGYLTVYPTGGALPLVSTINYTAGQTIANAAIVPSSGGSVTVFAGVSGTHVVIDINGYFSITLNAGKQLSLFGSVDGQGLISGTNFSSVTGSTGVSGTATGSSWSQYLGVKGSVTAATGSGSAGVKGIAPNAGNVYGVVGEITGTFGYPAGSWGVVGAGKTGGVYGTAPVSGSATSPVTGVLGEVSSYVFSSQYNVGVQGVTTGTFSQYGVGVVGRVGNASIGYPPGWGVVGGGAEYKGGVHGVIGSSYSSGKAVYGALHSGGFTYLQGGSLGYKSGATVYGVYSEGDFGGTGAKYFVEPHPTDPEKVIRYVALEGPEAGTYFRGTARTAAGEAVIEVPESFRFVTDEEGLTVQLTPVGDLATMAVMSQDLRQIVVRSSKDVAFHYQVNGVRKAFRDHQPVAEGAEFRPDTPKSRLPQYLPEESRRRLVENGTYNQDGTVNRRTADRLGWSRDWEERAKVSGMIPSH